MIKSIFVGSNNLEGIKNSEANHLIELPLTILIIKRGLR